MRATSSGCKLVRKTVTLARGPVRSLGQRGASSQPIGAAAATVSAGIDASTGAGTGVGGALRVIKEPAMVADRAPGTAAEGTTAAAAAAPISQRALQGASRGYTEWT